jgi:hypothetical protein
MLMSSRSQAAVWIHSGNFFLRNLSIPLRVESHCVLPAKVQRHIHSRSFEIELIFLPTNARCRSLPKAKQVFVGR